MVGSWHGQIASACRRWGLAGALSMVLPFCWADVAMTPTVEEQRLDRLIKDVPRLASVVTALERKLKTTLPDGLPVVEQSARVAALGIELWDVARSQVQSLGVLDDRPLYWQRLQVARYLRNQAKRSQTSTSDLSQWLTTLEQHSRGQLEIVWQASGAKRVLITGFDPFSLDRALDQSNPSGLIALALDGKVFEVSGQTIEIHAAIFPVRYPDFDAGLLEAWLMPHLLDSQLSLFASISMGRDHFDLERFPGRRRSSSALGNLKEHTGASEREPLPPLLAGKPISGPEFVEFSLPVAAMLEAKGAFEIRDNRAVTTLEQGTIQAASLRLLQGQTAVRGSGGGYLSNEISYRSIRLAQSLNIELPMGHIHTPRMQGHDDQVLSQILAQIQIMLLQGAVTVHSAI